MQQQDFVLKKIHSIKKLSDEFEGICSEYSQITRAGISTVNSQTQDSLLAIRDFQNRIMEVLVALSDIASKNSKKLPSRQAEHKLEEVLSRYNRRFLKDKNKEFTLNALLEKVSHIVTGLLLHSEKQLPFRIYPASNAIVVSPKNSEEKLDSSFELFRTVPKFAIFTQTCLKQGIELDSLVCYSEALDSAQFRKAPYHVCYVSTQYGIRTVCISDQIGEMTHVYNGFVDLTFFKTLQKGERTKEFSVRGIVYTSQFGVNLEEVLFSDWQEQNFLSLNELNKNNLLEAGKIALGNTLQSNLELAEVLKYQTQLIVYEQKLAQSGIICMNGIWYFSDAQGANKWPKIEEKHLSNFPSRKWNQANGIGGPTGSISNGIELKKMFAALGMRVASDQEENKRFAEILTSYGVELAKSGIYMKDATWYFGSAKGIAQWPKNIHGRRLQSFPNATFLRNAMIGSKQPIISSVSELKKMFAALGIKVATEEEERKKWADILVVHASELGEGGITLEDGIWYFGDAKGIDNWPEIKDGGLSKKLSHFPNIVFNQDNKIGNQIGVLTHPAELKKMFAALGIKVATEEEERKKWADILVAHASELGEGGITLEDGIWYFGDAKGLKKQKMIHGKYLGSYPRTFFNAQNGIGNNEGTLLSILHVSKMFASLGLRIATEEEEKQRWKKILIDHKEAFQKMGVVIGEESWNFANMVGNGAWEKIDNRSLSNFPNATYNRLLGIGNHKGELLSKKEVARMAESLGIKAQVVCSSN